MSNNSNMSFSFHKNIKNYNYFQHISLLMRSNAKHAGNYTPTAQLCVNKNYECTVVPTQNNYVHFNVTNLNGRTIIEMSYVEKKNQELCFFF